MESVILTQWVHPFPFRTRKLSAAVAKILSWRRLGKIAHSRHKGKGKLNKFPFIFQYSSLAQSVEHLTVNQGVAGSSPAGGARKKPNAIALGFFQRNKSLAGFVKCTSCVKYASRVKCATAREGIYFISHCDYREQYFTIFARKLFHIHRR